jgi:hypothetical protein
MSFSLEMLLDYFEIYNEGIWPMQWVGCVLGLLSLIPLFRPSKTWNRVTTGVLAVLWLWLSLVFWRQGAANMAILYVPTALFGLQGILFLVALARGSISYGPERSLYTAVGLVFIAYALAGYPLLGMLVGHAYPRTAISPLFPCPGIILTFGVLLFARRVPRHLLVIPALWALSGVYWFSLGMVEDAGLVIAGIVGVIMISASERVSHRAMTAAPQG